MTLQLERFIAELDMFYLGTANNDGQPYIQYRGGSPGFLKIVNQKTLGFADFGGKRHIHKRFSQKLIAPEIEKLQGRIAELEAKLKVHEPDG